MSLIAIETEDGLPIAIGTPIVIDSISMKARVYDPFANANNPDPLEDIVGVSYPKSRTLGRLAANVDGMCFSDFDFLQFAETLQYTLDESGAFIENPEYDPMFNAATEDGYVFVAMMGLCPVLKGESVPARWRKVREGVDYDLYLVR